MKLRYLLVVCLLPVFAACSKSEEAAPAEPAATSAQTTAAVVPTPAPEPAEDEAAASQALAAQAAPEPATESTTPEPVAAPAPAVAKAAEPSASSAKKAIKNVVEGVDYVTIIGGEPFDTPKGQVEVAEVFNYVCPACAGFDKVFQEWKEQQPAYVHVVYVPADFRPDFKAYARAFYAADALGLVAKTHAAVYAAIHERHTLPGEGMTLDPDKIAAFYAQYGADPAEFKDLMTSFSVETKVNKAHQFMVQSQIRSTPSLVVDGKYLIKGKTREDMLSNADALVARTRAGR